MNFDVNGVNIYNKILPRDINNILHKRLLGHARWNVVTDNLPIDVFQQVHGGTDAGSIIVLIEIRTSDSIRVESEWIYIDDDFDDPLMRDLNFYAEIIGMLVLDRLL